MQKSLEEIALDIVDCDEQNYGIFVFLCHMSYMYLACTKIVSKGIFETLVYVTTNLCFQHVLCISLTCLEIFRTICTCMCYVLDAVVF